MHILIVPSEHLVTELSPLAGIFQLEQAKALSKAGNKVGIISVGFVTFRYLFRNYPYKKYEKLKGVDIYRCYEKLFFLHRFYPFRILKKKYVLLFEKLYLEYIEKYGVPDVVHAHNAIFAGFIGLHINIKYKIPCVVTEHSSGIAKNLISEKIVSSLKYLYCSLNVSTCVSTSLQSVIYKRCGVLTSILHNIVDSSFFRGPLLDLQSRCQNFVFLNAASLDGNKNHRLLINAFAREFKYTNAVLRIAGSGPLLGELKSLARSLGVEKQVFFLGRLDRTQVKNEMLKANCFVLSSNFETFGVVLIEALACGTPLISTRSGGPEDIVNKNNGILVDTGNTQQLAAAMLCIYSSLEYYRPEKLRSEAKARFGEDKFVQQALFYYMKAINDQNS